MQSKKSRHHHVDERKVWHFDQKTLNEAWKNYYSNPANGEERFGQWFWNRYYVSGMISWPGLFYETDPKKAFALLQGLVRE